MKFEKKIVALLLVFVLLLSGCTNGQLSATDDTTAGTTAGTTAYIPPTDETTKPSDPVDETTVNTEPDNSMHCQYLPKTVENPDNLPVLKWVCLTQKFFGGGNRTWSEEAAAEVNQMLADRNMPFRIQFVLLTMSRNPRYSRELFEYEEAQVALQDADLIYAKMDEIYMKEYLTPITEYVTGNTEPSLKNVVPHEYDWLSGTVEGEIYGHRTTPYSACADGWQVDPALMAAAGLTIEDFQKDFWEMDDVFAKLYVANGNRPFLYLWDGGSEQTIGDFRDNVGFINMSPLNAGLLPECYGEICTFFAVDYSLETPTVVSYLETEFVKNVADAASRYKAANYTTEDPDQVRLSYTDLYTHSKLTYTSDNGDLCIPVTEAYYTAVQTENFVSGVAAVSQYKEEAVALLNLIAEDKEFRTHFFYGKENRDYKIVDGYYEMIIQEDGSNYSLDFLSPLSYFCGLTANMEKENNWVQGPKNWHLSARDGKTALQTYQDILDYSVCAYPILFDDSEFRQELEAMAKLYKRNYIQSFGTSIMTETQRQRLVEDMKAAGSDKVLAELQRQLSEWQKNNPDWPLKPED